MQLGQGRNMSEFKVVDKESTDNAPVLVKEISIGVTEKVSREQDPAHQRLLPVKMQVI